MTRLKTVAFDIETTGFQTSDQVTVVGFDADISSRVFLNVDDRGEPSSLAEQLDEEMNPDVVLLIYQSETTHLRAVTDFVESTTRSVPS